MGFATAVAPDLGQRIRRPCTCTLGESLPSARPARYLCIKYPGSSPKFILTEGSPLSRPHWTANLPCKARCVSRSMRVQQHKMSLRTHYITLAFWGVPNRRGPRVGNGRKKMPSALTLPPCAGIRVGRSRSSQLAAKTKKNGENEKGWGKWGEMGGNRGKWGEMGNRGKLPKIHSGEGGKMREIGRKREENWRKMAQISHFSQSHFPCFSTTSPPFPQIPLMNFASRTRRLEAWEFRDRPTSADFSASADGCL